MLIVITFVGLDNKLYKMQGTYIKKCDVVPEIRNLELLLETQIIIMRHKEFFE
jgi:hypothetical protein